MTTVQSKKQGRHLLRSTLLPCVALLIGFAILGASSSEAQQDEPRCVITNKPEEIVFSSFAFYKAKRFLGSKGGISMIGLQAPKLKPGGGCQFIRSREFSPAPLVLSFSPADVAGETEVLVDGEDDGSAGTCNQAILDKIDCMVIGTATLIGTAAPGTMREISKGMLFTMKVRYWDGIIAGGLAE